MARLVSTSALSRFAAICFSTVMASAVRPRRSRMPARFWSTSSVLTLASPASRVALDHRYGVARARYEVSFLLPATLLTGTAALSAAFVFFPRPKVPVSVEVSVTSAGATLSGRF